MDSLAFFILKKSCFEKRDRNSGRVSVSDADVSVKVSIRSATTACDSLYCSALVDGLVSSSSSPHILFFGQPCTEPAFQHTFFIFYFYFYFNFFLFFVFSFFFFFGSRRGCIYGVAKYARKDKWNADMASNKAHLQTRPALQTQSWLGTGKGKGIAQCKDEL